MNRLAFYLALVSLNLRSSWSSGFWLQMVFMVLNNAIFWVIWMIFFKNFDHINGWRLPEVTLMYATCQLAWGLKVVFFGGTRNLAKTIADGDLDRFLLQPRYPLFHVATTRSFASGWGDLVSGLILCLVSGLITPTTAPLYGFAVLCASVTFLAAEVILHSAAFWLGPTNTLSRQLTEYLIMLSCYPQNIYSGWVKVLMFVVVPAAVIGYLPVEVVHGSVLAGVELIGLTSLFALGALAIFARGLRRYVRG